ncbi:MAG: Do family serine endopeptidase [Bacteroidales bacterium]|nr:Do family serine endopeptidase [Bacteroidales bacterium]
MNKNLVTVISSVVLSCLAAGFIVKAATPDRIVKADGAGGSVPGAAFRTVNLSETSYPDFTYAAESSVDAVVFVKVTVKSQVPQMNDPFFQFFFGGTPQMREREQQGSGSGVIIRQDGYIVTNNHVVAGASKIEVTLNNNKTYEAKLIGTDPATDVALIKIEAEDLPVIPMGDSDRLRLGEWVIAIGSPYNLRSTITAGIVSAKGRAMNSSGEFKIESFIQTDAAVNPGNSGGALVNKAGQLVGINTMIYSQTGSYSGYSFAVPVNIVKKIVSDLIDFGSVKRVRLGVTMTAIDEKTAKDLKLSSLDGVYIVEVAKGSSAEKAGIKKGDVLTAIDSTAIKTPSGLQEKVNSFHPSDKAVLKVIRDGKLLELKVVFDEPDESTGAKLDDGTTAFYGGKLREADPATLAALGLREGVEVSEAGSGRLSGAGVEDGFVILYVNEQQVRTPEDVVKAASKAKRAVLIEGVTREGRSAYYAIGKD